MTKEEFNNLLRVSISADKKWYTTQARLVEFMTKDGSEYAIVYNECTKRFQRVLLENILSVEDPMAETESKEVEENVETTLSNANTCETSFISKEREYYGGC